MRKPSLYLGLLLTLSVVCNGLAQTKITYKERRADRHFQELAFHRASKLYLKILDQNPTNDRVKLKLAQTYFKVNNTEKAELYFAEVIHKKALVKSAHYLQYAQILQSNGKFDQASMWAKKYLAVNPRSEVAQNMIYSLQNIGKFYQDSTRYTVKTLNINTKAAEFAPTFFNNGIVFSSSRSTKINLQKNYSWDKSKFLDLYYSEGLIGNDMMTTPEKIKGKINTRYHEGPATFYQDHNQVIFTRNTVKNGNDVTNLNLYFASWSAESNQWTNVQSLPFNSKNYSTGHPAMDDLEAELYFVSDMPGGQGGTDLYKVFMVQGKWGVPQNLGPTINTPGDEMFPYINSNQKLYFASNGHGGLGGLDIFSIDPKDPEAKVMNMGFPVNSTKDDFGLIYDPSKNLGYFSSNRSGNDDLYQYQQESTILNITVSNEQSEPFSKASVSLKSNGFDLDTKLTNELGIATFEVSKGSEFQITGTASGYESSIASVRPQSPSLDVQLKLISQAPAAQQGTLLVIAGADENKTFVITDQRVIEVKEHQDNPQEDWLTVLLEENNIEISENIEIDPIHYRFDRADIDQKYQQELDQLAELMNKYSFLEFELNSHTDNRGSVAYNQHLSKKRALNAQQYLMDKGIDAKRLLAVGHGESRPINKCMDTPACNNTQHQINRRTEFRLIYMDDNQVVSNY